MPKVEDIYTRFRRINDPKDEKMKLRIEHERKE